MDGFTQLLDEPAHIISSPIADVTETARIGCIHLLIRNLLASYRIRIEVVVDMKTIDIITARRYQQPPGRYNLQPLEVPD